MSEHDHHHRPALWTRLLLAATTGVFAGAVRACVDHVWSLVAGH